MSITRRNLLKAGASAAALVALPRPLLARIDPRSQGFAQIQNPRVKELAMRALDAARTTGALYADVRLTHTRTRTLSSSSGVSDSEKIVVGVRALVNGYWGFASGPIWSPDEMARLGRGAVHQAKISALGMSRLTELAPVSAMSDGHWVMPVELDPFKISPFEIVDYLKSLHNYVRRFSGFDVETNVAAFFLQEKAFGSTGGSYCSQRLYRSEGVFEVSLSRNRQRVGGGSLDRLTPAGLGWELYRGQPLRDHIRTLMEEIREDAALPTKPVEVGRFDTVLDAWSVARLLDQTLGRATELDRALGYEANAGGTSYINDPFEMLTTYQAGAPSLTLTANRSEPGGAATVKWDDEGVPPDDFPIVKDGVLTDFQTTRESAGWLKESYAKHNKLLRSHGCANAPSALYAPLTHTPNLTMAAGGDPLDFGGLVDALRTGIAVKGAHLDMDFQNLNGLLTGRFYEVKAGKRIARLSGAAALFRAPELWKSLLALGGQRSMRRYGVEASKGEPAQKTYHSLTAVPAAVKQLTVIDVTRKA